MLLFIKKEKSSQTKKTKRADKLVMKAATAAFVGLEAIDFMERDMNGE